MPNVAQVLKEEITRLARREIRVQFDKAKAATARHQRDIVELKRQVKALERQLGALERQQGTAPKSRDEASAPTRVRFSPKGVKSHRERLGLSAADYAKLLDVSSQTIYNWEGGATTPSADQKLKIAALRSVGKREARKRLAESE